MRLVLVGIGGVGSRFAEMFVRYNLKHHRFKELVIVDPDVVETKNLQRQMYFRRNIDRTKVDSLYDILKEIDNELLVYKYTAQILSEAHLDIIANPGDLCVCCTDDIRSKQVISNYFRSYIIAAVDRGIVEITVDREYDKIWSFGTGYEVEQDVINNTVAALLLLKQVINLSGGITITNRKVNINELI